MVGGTAKVAAAFEPYRGAEVRGAAHRRVLPFEPVPQKISEEAVIPVARFRRVEPNNEQTPVRQRLENFACVQPATYGLALVSGETVQH